MGITDPLPDRVLRLVSKADRKALGPAGDTYDEAQERAAVRLERELHAQFANWLRLSELPFLHGATHRKPTFRVGWPDFTVISGTLVCLVEFKTSTGRLSEDQKTVIAELESKGTPVLVTTDLAAAITFTKQNLKLTL